MQSEQEHPPQGAEKHEQRLDPRTPEAMLKIIKQADTKDIVELHRYLEHASTMAHERERTEQLTDQEGYYVDLHGALEGAIERLPSEDLDRAREVYTELAESPVAADRSLAGLAMYFGMAKYDREFAVDHLSRLVRDYDSDVRERCHEPITYTEFERETSDQEQAKAVAAINITLEDAWSLHHAYLEAEAGNNLHGPQREAFERIIGGTWST